MNTEKDSVHSGISLQKGAFVVIYGFTLNSICFRYEFQYQKITDFFTQENYFELYEIENSAPDQDGSTCLPNKPHIREAYGVTYYGPCAPLRSDVFPDYPRDWETPQISSIKITVYMLGN